MGRFASAPRFRKWRLVYLDCRPMLHYAKLIE